MFRMFRDMFASITALFVGTLFTVLFAMPMFAQSPGDIRFTATTEIAVPGHLLPAGDYVFRRLNSTEPNIYEILNGNGELVTVAQVTPTVRPNRGDTEIDVKAPDSDGVRMVKSWFGPGNTDGYQFVYSKKAVRKLDQLAEAQAKTSGSLAGQP
jgi:hypothetical protein